MQKYVIIVAGGKGLRMGGEIPKQFLPLKDTPILMRTIQRFYEYDSLIKVVLVLPKDHFSYWKKLCDDYSFTVPCQLVEGGESRYHSVKNGLLSIRPQEEALVAVHDGVRPFVSVATLQKTFDTAEKYKTAVPVIESVDSLREIVDEKSVARDRSKFFLVQTPQVFSYDVLINAYQQAYRTVFTDDASVVESSGYDIKLVEGNRENIKITTMYDLKIAKALVE
jgi:2-C-methyl-D-erythritol 4-phosphate cytidylyltransferase